MIPENKKHCGYVAIIGQPNVGKSSLLNRLVGEKLAIVTHKPQTTRTKILGIAIEADTQIIFVDTPGIFEPNRPGAWGKLDKAMVNAAHNAAREADICLTVVDCQRFPPNKAVMDIIEGIPLPKERSFLAINKVDLIEKSLLLPQLDFYGKTDRFAEIFCVSAQQNKGLGDLSHTITKYMPESMWLYPEEEIATMPMRLLAAETTREQLFLQLHEELPYHMNVETELWEEEAETVRIMQTIFVSRDSHKAMVIGNKGQKLKMIGRASRLELQKFLQKKVHLELFVKLSPNWADDREYYERWGLEK
ncbi:MAG: GTPase Era [Alphaproteobacteria bacterium]